MKLNGRAGYLVFAYIPGEEWEEGKRELWEEGIREGETGLVMGDFIARVGERRTTWIDGIVFGGNTNLKR